MGIEKNILKKVLTFGIEKGYFELSTIRNLDKTCCKKSKIKVIDFDLTKNTLYDGSGKQPKSCDALKFFTSEIICKNIDAETIKICDILKISERIDFIEMKSTKNLSKRKELNIKSQIEKYNFVRKINDSLEILENIIQKNGDLTVEEQKIFHNIDKQLIFLTDVDFDKEPVTDFEDTLEFLAKNSTDIRNLIKYELNKVKPNSLNNLQQPKLMDCKTFEKNYKL